MKTFTFLSRPIRSTTLVLLSFLSTSTYGQKLWTGNTNSNWNTASNWSGSTLPANGNNIVINPVNYTGAASSPTISTASSFQAGDVDVRNGAVWNIQANLTTQGNITFDGNTGSTVVNMSAGTLTMTGSNKSMQLTNEATFNLSGGTVSTVKEFQVYSGSRVNISGSATLNANDKVQIQGKKTLQSLLNVSGGTVNITSALELDGAGTTSRPKLNISGGTINANAAMEWKGNNVDAPNLTLSGGTLTVLGILSSGSSSGYFDININGGTVVLKNHFTSGSVRDTIKQTGGILQFDNGNYTWTLPGAFLSTGGQVIFNGSTSFSSGNASLNFNNVKINNGKTLSIGGSINNIFVAGDWLNDNGTFDHNNKKVTFNGTASQSISKTGGTETFYDVIINNTSSSIPQLTMNSKIQINNSLTMTKGNINLNNDTLILGTSTTNLGTLVYTNGWFYGGSFKRWFNAATVANGNVKGLFPMGGMERGASTRPLYISMPTTAPTAGGTLNVFYQDNATASDVSFMDDVPVERRHNAYWKITSSGITGGTFNLSGRGSRFKLVSDVNHLRLILTGSCVGSPGTNAGDTSDVQVNRTGLSLSNLNNSFFIGSINGIASPLPVTWLNFEVDASEGKANIKWSTASEQNNNYFTIERSKDGQNFESISTERGAIFSSTINHYSKSDPAPYDGLSYYRIKQTDFDGKSSLSEIRPFNKTSFKHTLGMKVFPNPLVQNQNLKLKLNGTKDTEILVVVRDLLGKEFYSKIIILENNDQVIAIDPTEQLSAGVYLITGSTYDSIYSKTLIVK